MNKITRKSLSLILCMLLVLTSVSPVFASTVGKTDYDSHWAKTMIQSSVESGIVKGYPDGSFKPDNSITRAEFFTIVNNAFDFEEMSDKKINDVASKEWYAAEVAKALEAGYVKSYLNGNIEPMRDITREEAAVIISNVKNLKSKSTLNPFTDSEMSAESSMDQIISVFEAKIMGGYPDGSFKPQAEITRAEAVVTLIRALDYKAAVDYTYDKAIVYGSDEQTTVDGNIIIKKAGATLKNLVVTGDLTIAKEVAEGDVTLDGVVVKGSTFVNGGGSNSIHFINTTIEKLYVDKKSSSVRIVASGTTNVNDVIVRSSVRLDEESLSQSGFKNLLVEKTNDKKMLISLIGTKITKADIAGEFVTLNMTSTSKISTLDIEGKNTKIIGKGIISEANVKSDGVIFEKQPTKVSVGKGVEDPKVTNKTSSTSSSSSSSSSSSRGSSGGSSSGGGTSTPSVGVSSVALSSSMTTLEAGDTGAISAVVSPSNATNKSVTWSSSDNAIATVASNGVVTAKGAGTATITATASGRTDTLNVVVSSTANVASVAEFTAALNGQGVTTINLTSDITGDVTATRLGSVAMIVDFDAYKLTGDLDLTANSTIVIAFNGDAGDRIDGNIILQALNATVTNNIDITGSATLNGVGFASYEANGIHGEGIDMHGQGRLNLSGDASAAVVHITTPDHVVLAGTIDKVEIEVDDVEATIEGTVTNVVVEEGSDSARVELASTATVTNLDAYENMDLACEGLAAPTNRPDHGKTITDTVSYRVSFHKNTGDVDAHPDYKLVDDGTALGTLPEDPKKTNHTFVSWNTLANGSGTTIDETTTISAAITAYAKWATIAVTEVTVTGTDGSTSVLDGSTLQMIATIAPPNATDQNVTWSVVDGTGKATINGTGLLTGTEAGTVTVNAVADGVTGSLEVTVISKGNYYSVESSFGSASVVPSILSTFKLCDEDDALIMEYSLYRNDELIAKTTNGSVTAPNGYFTDKDALIVKINGEKLTITIKK